VEVPVDDPGDPRLRLFTGLRDYNLRRLRESPGGDCAGVFIADGDVVAERAQRAGCRLLGLLVDARRTRPFPFEVPGGVPVYRAAPTVLEEITGYHLHRGVLACFERPAPTPPATVLADARRLLVLEGVNNPTNLGVIVRSGAGLGFDGLVLDPTCCDPYYRRSARVSMGEVFALPHARLEPFPHGLRAVVDAGFEVVALTPAPDATPLDGLSLNGGAPVALVLGAEGPGLEPATLAAAHHRVRIPMAGAVDSLNVGAAAAVACWAVSQAAAQHGPGCHDAPLG
jgi:tRNA G18 (ribose-2'-O)-methylase SpoU